MDLETDNIIRVGPGFWNFRGKWKKNGVLEIGTQMSVIKLPSGKFLVLDCIDLTPSIKKGLDAITDNGRLIEALILTHPFHLTFFPCFVSNYPKVLFYGTPRHHRKFPQLEWAGDVFDSTVRAKWLPEVDMRIPAGMEFVRPMPEKTNHMCGLFVFHEPSRTIHENDTLIVGYKPGLFHKLKGVKHRRIDFNPCIRGPGLLPTPNSPFEFRDWLLEIIRDWDFDNVVAAHMGPMIGGAKAELQRLVLRSDPLLQLLQKRFKARVHAGVFMANNKLSRHMQEAEAFDGDTTCECG